MNCDALGVGNVDGGAEQPLVGRPAEVVEAAEVADVGTVPGGAVVATAAHGGRGGVQVVLRVPADMHQSPAG